MLTTSHDSAASRLRIAEGASAIAKTTWPPASCHAWASARLRMAWPVPILRLASVRIRRFIAPERLVESWPLLENAPDWNRQPIPPEFSGPRHTLLGSGESPLRRDKP